MKIPKIPGWVWVALKELDMWKGKGVDRLIQRNLQPGSIVIVVLNRSITLLFLWGGAIFALTILIWGLRFSEELVEKFRYFLIRIPKIIFRVVKFFFWVVAQIAKLLKKLFK